MTAARTRTAPVPRWRRRPQARPEEILRAALTVFGQTGYAPARLADIAKAAGVSKGTLYRYFESKEALFRDMVRAYARTSLDQEDAAAGFFPDSAEKKLRRFLRDTWAALSSPELRQITRLVHAELTAFPELARFYFDEVILRIRVRLERVLESGRSRGEFRAVTRNFALHAIPSLLLHQAMLRDGLDQLDAERPSDELLLEGSLDLLLHGLLRRGTRTAAE